MITKRLYTKLELYENIQFLLTSLKVICRGDEKTKDAFYLLCNEIKSGDLGIWIQYKDEEPYAVLAIKKYGTEAEILLSDYRSSSLSQEVLENHAIPWLQQHGVQSLKTLVPYDSPKVDRYLKRFQLERVEKQELGVIYQRMV